MINQFYVYLAADSSEESAAKSSLFSESNKFLSIESLENLSTESAAYQFDDDKLKLWLLLDGKLSELSFDLAEGEVAFRATRVSKSNEVVAKALGCKPHFRPTILDATAGMGRDSLIMAMLGCKVEMQERNPTIFHLLENALQRFEKQGGPREL
ncbi:MAG: class I SAM-dependent methyltransferase, partial [Kangiellaceae bacterium]|nr:class I SAM-dependent methyltransferase [Kangiellaceae bacterium]